MSENPTPTEVGETSLAVGVGNGGVLLVMKQGDTELSVTLDIDEAYAHQGHVLTAAITLEQSVYIRRMQEQLATQRMMERLNTQDVSGGGGSDLWTP